MEATVSIFTEILGSSPYLKVLDHFLIFDRFDYTKSQVAKDVGISRVTIEKIWQKLIEKKLIMRSRKIGRAELYKLNTADPYVKILQKALMDISHAYANSLRPAQKPSAAKLAMRARA